MPKDLPPGGFNKAYSHRTLTYEAAKPLSCMCNKKRIEDVVRLAKLGAFLAEQAHTRGRFHLIPLRKL